MAAGVEMMRAIVDRASVLAGLVLMLPAFARGQQQRMAPLPPACSVPGLPTAKLSVRQPQQAVSLAVLPLSVSAGAGSLVFLSDGLPNGVANRIGSGVTRIYVVGRRAQRRRPPTNAPPC